MGDDPKKSVPPDPAAAKVAQDLLAQIHKDFVVEKKVEVPVGDANKGAQLGQDLLAQLNHDFGVNKKAEDEARLQALGQQLLGAITRDFGSVRPAPGVGGSLPSIPAAPRVPSSPGTVAAPLATPPGYAPPPAATISLAPPPPPELVKAEEELQKLETAPLAKDEEAELEAMQGRGALGFLRKLFKR